MPPPARHGRGLVERRSSLARREYCIHHGHIAPLLLQFAAADSPLARTTVESVQGRGSLRPSPRAGAPRAYLV